MYKIWPCPKCKGAGCSHCDYIGLLDETSAMVHGQQSGLCVKCKKPHNNIYTESNGPLCEDCFFEELNDE